MSKKPHFQSHTIPADMHNNGVYFNEELKAKKEAKLKEKKQLKNETTKNKGAKRNHTTNIDQNNLTKMNPQ